MLVIDEHGRLYMDEGDDGEVDALLRGLKEEDGLTEEEIQKLAHSYY